VNAVVLLSLRRIGGPHRSEAMPGCPQRGALANPFPRFPTSSNFLRSIQSACSGSTPCLPQEGPVGENILGSLGVEPSAGTGKSSSQRNRLQRVVPSFQEALIWQASSF
jgi:hypothetical protein